MPVLTDLDKFRLELGDINSAAPLFNDDEAQYYLDEHPSSVLLAVAAACDSLARRYSRDVDVATDGQSIKRSQKAAAYLAQAKECRARARSANPGAPWAGGQSKARKGALADDTDRVQPNASRGEFSGPGTI